MALPSTAGQGDIGATAPRQVMPKIASGACTSISVVVECKFCNRLPKFDEKPGAFELVNVEYYKILYNICCS